MCRPSRIAFGIVVEFRKLPVHEGAATPGFRTSGEILLNIGVGGSLGAVITAAGALLGLSTKGALKTLTMIASVVSLPMVILASAICLVNVRLMSGDHA